MADYLYLFAFIATSLTFWYWIAKIKQEQSDNTVVIVERKQIAPKNENTDVSQNEFEFKRYRMN